MHVRSELERMACDYARTRDPATRERLVVAHQPLARMLAHQMRRWSEPRDDLAQAANIGLLAAIDRFETGHGASFHTFAEATMRGEIHHHFRRSWRVHVPRTVAELALRLGPLTATLAQELQRTPTLAETALRAGVSTDAVGIALQARQSFRPAALDALRDAQQGAPGDEQSAIDDAAAATALLARLSPEKRAMLTLIYIDGHTQTEVAVILGCSQAMVSRTVRAALAQLRSYGPPNEGLV